MLQNIRDNAQGTIAKVVVGLIVFTFALFGVDSIIGSLGGKPKVATVNGVDITETTFNSAVEHNRRQLLNQMGEHADPALIDESKLKKSVLDDLISQSLNVQAANSQGLYVSSKLTEELIKSVPQFQSDGQFSNKKFIALLNTIGQNSKQFTDDLKKRILISQSRNGIVGSEFSLPGELSEVVSINRQTRDAAVLKFPQADFLSKVEITDEQAKTYWQARQSDYIAPDEVDISYILLDENKLEDSIKVDDSVIQKRYQQELKNFVPSEERHAAHILIEINSKTSKKQALAKIEAIRKKIENGADFSALAKADSEDAGSAKSGGDLGFAGKGAFVPPFEKALFSMKVGEVSQPVLTQYGYHLIKLLGIRNNKPPTIAELAPSLEAAYKKSQAEKKYVDLTDKLANISYTSSTLSAPSDELKLPVLKAKNVLKKGETRPLFDSPKLMKVMFSPDLRSGDGNSDVIEISKTKSIVVHVDAFRPSHPLAFEDAKKSIIETLKKEEATKLAKTQGEATLQKLDKGVDDLPKSMAWKDKKGMNRRDNTFRPEVLEHIFSINMPEKSSKPIYKGFVDSTGDYNIVRLDAVHNGDYSKLSSDEKSRLNRILSENTGGMYYQDYQAYLKDNAKIVKH
jgi:peptidyl-prolyl cis-trans isomerase D